MSTDALLEIGTEEIPAAYLEPARRQLQELAAAFLTEHALPYAGMDTFATPRRLALVITGLAAKSADRTEELLGPSEKAGRDAQGNVTPAARGFAAKHGLKPEQLTVKATEKGPYLCAVKKTPGRKAEHLLAEAVPALIGKLYFPKTMIWEESGFRFARPIRTLMVLYGNKTVKCSVAGIPAGNWTVGLHAVGWRKIKVAKPASYSAALKNACVIVDPAERRQQLVAAIDAAARRTGGRAIKDEGLIDEVNYLIEHPVAVLSKFDEQYLRLPPEVLITCLKKKQKCFAMTDANGTLTNHFIGIRNGISEHQEIVRVGYERVLAARLSDAAFFFHKDTATPLAAKTEKLNGVTLQAKLGSMHDKTIRNEQLAVHIGAVIGNVSAVEIGRVAQLAKADLVTDMVFEYPELQGTVGRIYAQHDGESAAVAQAIEEHYWPLSAEGVLPASALGTVLSLADKFDMLAGDFAAGIIPSGSQDPHGLRRMAVGILRMIKEKQLPLSIRQTVETAFSLLPASVQADNRAAGLLLDFFRQRLENMLESDGFRFDEIRAAVAVGWDDLKDLLSRLNAVQQMRSQADFVPLAAAFKRASNILKQAAKQQIAVPGQVHADGLQEAAEQELYAGIVRLEQQIAADIAGKDYGAALLKLVSMKPEVDRFFEKVMVMADDHALRANRLALLNYASTLFSRVADLSQLQA